MKWVLKVFMLPQSEPSRQQNLYDSDLISLRNYRKKMKFETFRVNHKSENMFVSIFETLSLVYAPVRIK